MLVATGRIRAGEPHRSSPAPSSSNLVRFLRDSPHPLHSAAFRPRRLLGPPDRWTTAVGLPPARARQPHAAEWTARRDVHDKAWRLRPLRSSRAVNEVVKVGPNAPGVCSAVVAPDDGRKNWRHCRPFGRRPYGKGESFTRPQIRRCASGAKRTPRGERSEKN